MAGWAIQTDGCDIAPVPLWAFHGGADETVPPEYDRAMIDAINDCNPPEVPLYTEYPNVGHNSWTRTYSNSAAPYDSLTEPRGGDCSTTSTKWLLTTRAKSPPWLNAASAYFCSSSAVRLTSPASSPSCGTSSRTAAAARLLAQLSRSPHRQAAHTDRRADVPASRRRPAILRNTQAQAQALEAELAQRGFEARVLVTMRVARPRAEECSERGAPRLVRRDLGGAAALPALLLCHHALELRRAGAATPPPAEHERLVEIRSYPEEPAYLDAMAECVRQALAKVTLPCDLVFSAHGLPLKLVKDGDPYPQQIDKTVAGIRGPPRQSAAAPLGLPVARRLLSLARASVIDAVQKPPSPTVPW